MKRYTGQQALYEAISRSRAKAKQGSILEKLRPEPAKPATELEPTTEPVVQEPAEPQVVETPVQATTGQEPQAKAVVELPLEPRAEASPAAVEPPEPVVMPRPVERVVHPASPSPVRTWLRPRPVQINEGRIEISVPYYIGLIAGLVMLVVVLGAYRLGQAGSGGRTNEAAAQVQPVVDRAGGSTPQGATATDTGRSPANPAAADAARQDVASARPQGDHWIVLAQYRRQEDFAPVIRHFAEHGIGLAPVSLERAREFFAANGLNVGVLPSGDGFLLVTTDAFNNPKVAGTDGFKMVQKIAEVGAQYKGKAPAGLERFAPNYFSDAYGMKIVR